MENNKIKSKFKIIFIGTPNFGAIILKRLIKNYRPVLVVTEPDKPAGRHQVLTPPPVKLLAEKYKIPFLQEEKILNLKSQILNLKPDLIVVAAYGQILPEEILKIPKYGCLNIHPSLLPKYRGPSPIQSVILNGEKETGITIILMDEKMDAGPMIAKSKISMRADGSPIHIGKNPRRSSSLPLGTLRGRQKSKITYLELHNQLAELGADLLIEKIPKWIEGKIKPEKQNEAKATYTKIIKKEDGKIDWQKSAEEIERQIRAFYPWPGTFTFFKKNDKKILRIKILKAEVIYSSEKQNKLPSGKVFLLEEKLCVKCKKDLLEIKELQMEGKKSMAPAEFLKGNSDIINSILI